MAAEVERQFTDAMRSAGLATGAVIAADGALHRFHVEGDKSGTLNGWYVLYADGAPAGEFGSWKDGGSHVWRATTDHGPTAEEERHHRARMEAAKRQRQAERAAEQAAAAAHAARVWEQATATAADHPYLIAKAVRAFGICQRGEHLLVPLRDTTGTLHGLQFIGADGSEKFGSGTVKVGHHHSGSKPADVLAVAEGYATAATVHMATGWPMVAAFDACNLLPVVRALRRKYPGVLLLICADNDHRTEGNPGMTKARAATAEVAGIVVAPAFAAGSAGADWNDHARQHGIDTTTRQLAGVLHGVRHVA